MRVTTSRTRIDSAYAGQGTDAPEIATRDDAAKLAAFVENRQTADSALEHDARSFLLRCIQSYEYEWRSNTAREGSRARSISKVAEADDSNQLGRIDDEQMVDAALLGNFPRLGCIGADGDEHGASGHGIDDRAHSRLRSKRRTRAWIPTESADFVLISSSPAWRKSTCRPAPRKISQSTL
jgi:hypothetical protein